MEDNLYTHCEILALDMEAGGFVGYLDLQCGQGLHEPVGSGAYTEPQYPACPVARVSLSPQEGTQSPQLFDRTVQSVEYQDQLLQ